MNLRRPQIIFLILPLTGIGQDIQWSQPYNSLIYQNPAFTSINGIYNININHRNEWIQGQQSYQSSMLNADYEIAKGKAGARFGIGTIITFDRKVDGQYQASSSGLTVSGQVKMNRSVRLAGGLGYNFVQNKIGAGTIAGRSSAHELEPAIQEQTYPQAATKGKYSDFSTGLALSYDQSDGVFSITRRNRFIVGYSLSHINRPYTVGEISHRLAFRYTGYFSANFQLGKKFDLRPVALYYHQDGLSKYTAGSLIRYAIGQRSLITGINKGTAISIGGLYRLNEAIVPNIRLEKGLLCLSFSYDLPVHTHLQVGTGALEITISVLNPANAFNRFRKQ
jgi:type IX secretion system PorP/SprF family membrane protein